MIEKLARAMCDAPEPRQIADKCYAPPFDESEPDVQKFWQLQARACLEALREPSEEMLAVAVPEPTHLYAEYGRDDPEFESRMKAVTQVDRLVVREAWQSMIDVALERKAA